MINDWTIRITELAESINTKTDDKFVDLSEDIKSVDNELQRIVLLLLIQQSITIQPPKDARSLKRESMRKIMTAQELMYQSLFKDKITELELNLHVEQLEPQLFKAYERDWITKEKYFAVQSSFLLFYEKFCGFYPLEKYIATINFVDKHNITNLRTEELREKIASIFCQQGKFDSAINIYRKALDNYHKLNDESVAFRRRVGQSFMDYCSIFLNYELTDKISELLEAMREWEELVGTRRIIYSFRRRPIIWRCFCVYRICMDVLTKRVLA